MAQQTTLFLTKDVIVITENEVVTLANEITLSIEIKTNYM